MINFVYETELQRFHGLKCESLYKMHLVVSGNGKFHVSGEVFSLTAGDLFFTLPSMQYAIESEDDFEYMYISFLGIRANELADRLHLACRHCLFSGFSDLISLWRSSIIDDRNVFQLRCEGLLLYTFSMLGEQSAAEQNSKQSVIVRIKNDIEEHYNDPTLSLQTVAKKYSYHPKYLSGLYKKVFRIGMTQYIMTLRIQKACTLIEQGVTSVGDIAFQCGFSDPLYFSRVFKQKMGIAPKKYIADFLNQND